MEVIQSRIFSAHVSPKESSEKPPIDSGKKRYNNFDL